MSNWTSSDLNTERDLASIPMAQGGLSRPAIARLKSAGVPVTPLLKQLGTNVLEAWRAQSACIAQS
jgi:hypothetical protein